MTFIRRIRISNYKAFTEYSVGLRAMNILTGPNNCGKSTILNAFQLLDVGIRRARRRHPEPLQIRGRTVPGYSVAAADLSLSLENAHTDLGDSEASIRFDMGNANSLELIIPQDSPRVFLVPHAAQGVIGSSGDFKREFPIEIGVVPTVGPIDHHEELVEAETVRRGLLSHRAAGHFRNYWHHFREKFDTFRALLETTWPGTTIEPPKLEFGTGKPFLTMFCRERGQLRELYWAGFGFQVWCQLLSHIVRTADSTLIVLDEPDVYLHSDLHRRLLNLLRQHRAGVLLATHSTEIINEADPEDVLLVDKRKPTATRLKQNEGLQRAFDILGSTQNTQLSRLTRTRRALFVEGDDNALLTAFARKLELTNVGSGATYVVYPIDGFANWSKVRDGAWALKRAMPSGLTLAVVLDRDFRCAGELQSILASLRESVDIAHIHERKELENYLLIPEALRRAIIAAIEVRRLRGGECPDFEEDTVQLLETICQQQHDRLFAQYATKYMEFHGTGGKDGSTLLEQAQQLFRVTWAQLDGRLRVVSGKEALSQLNCELHRKYKVQLTSFSIIDKFTAQDVPLDLAVFLRSLEAAAS